MIERNDEKSEVLALDHRVEGESRSSQGLFHQLSELIAQKDMLSDHNLSLFFSITEKMDSAPGRK